MATQNIHNFIARTVVQAQGRVKQPAVKNAHRSREIVAKIAIARNKINTPRGGPIEHGGVNIHIQQKKTCSAVMPSPLCHHAHQTGPHLMSRGKVSVNHSPHASRARNLQTKMHEVKNILKCGQSVMQSNTNTRFSKVGMLSRAKATHQPFGL